MILYLLVESLMSVSNWLKTLGRVLIGWLFNDSLLSVEYSRLFLLVKYISQGLNIPDQVLIG